MSLGTEYENAGDSDTADELYKKAFDIASTAANGGAENVMGLLGQMYLLGVYVDTDVEAALEWFEKAIALGDSASMSALGGMYYLGEGVEQDYLKAFELLSMAADAGIPIAMKTLGDMYMNDEGVEKDEAKAQEWYGKGVSPILCKHRRGVKQGEIL